MLKTRGHKRSYHGTSYDVSLDMLYVALTSVTVDDPLISEPGIQRRLVALKCLELSRAMGLGTLCL